MIPSSEPGGVVKASILEAARIKFARKGFHGTAVSDVAQRAGVGKGTVYRHFGCKEKLLRAVILQGLQELNGQLRYVLNFFSSPIQAVEGILEVHVDQHERSGQFVEILSHGGNARGNLSPARVADGRDRGDSEPLRKVVFERDGAGWLSAE